MKKHLFAILGFVSLSLSISVSAQASIADWDQSIPLDSSMAVAVITAKVQDLTYADEGDYCGGHSWDHQLVDYYTTEDIDGSLTYFLTVVYKASLSLDFCRSEVVKDCSTTFQINEDGSMKAGEVICAE